MTLLPIHRIGTRRPRLIRSKTLDLRYGPKEATVVELYPEANRPKTRGDCEHGERPCPWMGCRHHLALDVKPNGNLRITWPDLGIDELEESCALDVAEQGPLLLEEIAPLLNVTRERVRQEEASAIRKLSRRFGREEP